MMVSPDENQLALELRTITSRLIKKLRAHSVTRDKLSLTERSVVKLLDKQGTMLPSEIARVEKVTTQSMSQILNHLAELNYINRQPLETDKRKVNIALSEAGQAYLHSVRHEADEWLSSAIRQTCSADEQAWLRRALEPLTKLVEYD